MIHNICIGRLVHRVTRVLLRSRRGRSWWCGWAWSPARSPASWRGAWRCPGRGWGAGPGSSPPPAPSCSAPAPGSSCWRRRRGRGRCRRRTCPGCGRSRIWSPGAGTPPEQQVSCSLLTSAVYSVYIAPAGCRWTWWGGWGCWWGPRTRGTPWRAAPAECWSAVSAGSSGAAPRPAPGPGSGCGGCWRWTAGTWRRCWGSSSLSSSSISSSSSLSSSSSPGVDDGDADARDEELRRHGEHHEHLAVERTRPVLEQNQVRSNRYSVT